MEGLVVISFLLFLIELAILLAHKSNAESKLENLQTSIDAIKSNTHVLQANIDYVLSNIKKVQDYLLEKEKYIEDSIDDSIDALRDIYHEEKDSIIEMFNSQLNDMATNISNASGKHISNLIKNINDLYKENKTNTSEIIELLKDSINSLSDVRISTDNVLSNVKNVQDYLSEKENEIADGIEDVREKFSHIYNTEKNAIIEMFNSKFFNLTKNIDEIYTKTSNSLSNLTASVKTQIFALMQDYANKIAKQNAALNDSISALSLSVRANSSLEEKHSIAIEKKLENLSIALEILEDSEKKLHQNTQSSFDFACEQLKQIDKLYDNFAKSCTKLLNEEARNTKIETLLSNVVARHTEICEMTTEMNNTSKEIFEFMKLYLIKSTLDNFNNDGYIR